MAQINFTCVDRLLKYVKFDTQSSEDSTSFPSTDKQKILAKVLVQELLDLGLDDAAMDEWGYVTATLPANIDTRVPVIGLIAHLDTSPDVSGKDVKTQIHKNYRGGDIVISKESNIILRADENPDLANQIGHDIITSDGTTLLGADNKAGIAEIFDAVNHLVDHPEIKHGTIKVAVMPDEEVGRGSEHFDIKKFGANYAYTVDGETLGEIEDETFCADAVTITVTGVNVHPGYGKNKLVNAVKIAAEIIEELPKDGLSPETTEKKEGYVHPHVFEGNVEQAVIKFLIRDFTVDGLKEKEKFLKGLSDKVLSAHPKASMEFKVDEYYRNMKYELDKNPKVVDYALEAVERSGIKPKRNFIRGGTDGAQLSYKGLLTPNIFTGGHNFHSRQEWVSAQDMQKAVEVILNLLQIWVEKTESA
ncbi:peptidase T [candidate division KSB1 bacterium]|nr:peptidase T [candidate division KSB1 bacterium]